MLLSWLAMKMMDPMMDEAMTKMMTEDYSDNPFLLVTVAEKLTPRAAIEAAIRAETGKELARPLGSPNVLSPWNKILLNPRQLFQLPTESTGQISTKTVIGPHAKKPLVLDLPVMITGMSYGGSLSLPMKIALAKGAALAGTSTNTGESAVTPEERDAAKFLIGQYHRGGWLSGQEQLSQLDAIEIQLGQGAWGGAVETSVTERKDEHLKHTWQLENGKSATIYSRMPGKQSTQDYIKMVNSMKSQYDVPVGVKIAGTDFIEYELAVIAQTKADYIVIDGAEGGTSSSPPTLQDDIGLPTLYTLVRTVNWLTANDLRDRFSIIIAGGMSTPGHFLKALALGADAVYIGTIALMAAMQAQAVKVLPQAPPSQLALYGGRMTDKLDIDKAARSLANFLISCTAEMKLAAQALGKQALNELGPADLVTVDKDLAEFIGIRYAGQIRRPRPSQTDACQQTEHQQQPPLQ
ncbi:FMN-binding glutamate synthase family protein|uniref:Glutamate synthase domain-containing protein 2 n=1 Tax=Dendrosporobacter quercicolus TaxID=146817 RepID=A0A1G9URZ5_9FIRM|nr:FMN-binding glutamate synthase family protein [Dendrosporobacter quercicolus]NSL48058.1 FMN-binding glutamate synthase family protein [Dendrosporobacter quercicolus DSM 1736]SDM62345.1 Glutamate synthase domain-containing protein 2 [Dendrosporobacter quercicolus]